MLRNNNLEVRILGPQDKDLFMRAFPGQQKIFGIKHDFQYNQIFPKILMQYLSGDERLIIGSINQGSLLTTLGMRFWREQAVWTLGMVKVQNRSGSQLFNMRRNGLAECMKEALNIAEQRGCNHYYTCTSLKNFKTYRSYFQKYVPHLYKNYSLNIEEVVPPRSHPKKNRFWGLMGAREWPIPLIIYSRKRNAEKEHDISL